MLKSRRAGLLAAICSAGLMAGLAGPVAAETLADAIGLAYQTNPTLREQRANLRALDETVVQALSGYRPEVGLSASVARSSTEYGGLSFSAGEASSASASITLSQPLYTGGRVRAQISAAQADIEAGRQTMRTV
jgi:outer membrane protein